MKLGRNGRLFYRLCTLDKQLTDELARERVHDTLELLLHHLFLPRPKLLPILEHRERLLRPCLADIWHDWGLSAGPRPRSRGGPVTAKQRHQSLPCFPPLGDRRLLEGGGRGTRTG